MLKKYFITPFIFIINFLFIINTFAQTAGDVVRYKKIGKNLGGLGSTISYGDYFGTSTCSIGDVDGDGIDDLAIGANQYGTCGAVFILFMDTNGTVSSQTILEQNSNGISGLTTNGLFGHDVCAMGDINGDGIPDIGISELQCSDGGSNTGAIHIITLNSSGNATSQTKISKTTGYLSSGLPLQIGAFFGANLDSIGDLNNDGIIDIVVGNHHDDYAGVNKGAAWVLLLDTNHKVSSYYKIYDGVTNFNAPIDTYDYFGVSCCGIGDYDNDGIPDIAIGAIYDDDGITDAGAFYIIHLNATGSVKSYTKISNLSFPNSNPLNNNSARSLTMIPDLDGNGTNEIVTGAYRYDADKGAAFIIFLDSNENVINHNLINYSDLPSIVSSSRFGSSLCSYGDYNQDGRMEMVVGAYKENSNTGSIYIVSLYSPFSVSTTKTNIQCYGDSSGVATATVSGSNPPYTYQWSNGSTNATINNLLAGTYSVTVTNSLNNIATSSTTITQAPQIICSTNSDTIICYGDSIDVWCYANGGSGSKTVHWDATPALTDGNTHIVSPTTNTIYLAWAIDAINCVSDTASIMVSVSQLPNVSLSGPNMQQCINDSTIALIGTPLGGVFSGNNGQGSNFEPSIAGVGIHQLIYTYTDVIGCSDADTLFTLINDIPTISTANDTTLSCYSSGVYIGEATENLHTYLWSPYAGLDNPFASNPLANPWQNTTFVVKKTSLITQCYNTDTVIVNLPYGAPQIDIYGDTIICSGDSIHLSYNTYSNGSIIWSNGSNGLNMDDIIINSQYVGITVIDVNQCIGKDSVWVTANPLPTPFIGNDTILLQTQNLTLDAGNYQSYFWSTGENTQSINIDGSTMAIGDQVFFVIVTDINTCKGSDTLLISFTNAINVNSVDESITLFPNPANNYISVNWDINLNIESINIFDITGAKVIEQDVKQKGNSINIDISELSKGNYFINLISKSGENYVVKMVKM